MNGNAALIHAVSSRIVGADIVELNPSIDVNGLTAVVAAKLLKEIAAQMLGGFSASLPAKDFQRNQETDQTPQ